MINKITFRFLLFSFISLSALSAHPHKKPNDSMCNCNQKEDHGFIGGAAGVKGLEKYAPTRTSSHRRLNQPLGQAKADQIAISLGLDKNLCFTKEQYLAFITGQGADGSGNPEDAKLVDESVKLLTNTCGNPLIRIIDGEVTQIILGSYGLIVNEAGMLESPANPDAPTRQVNAVIQPGGYMSTWCMANGAEESLSCFTDRLIPYSFPMQLPHSMKEPMLS